MSKTIEEIKAKRLLKDYIESKKNQIQELTAWKESASKVFKNLDLQAIGKTLGIGLGEDISVNVLPKIKEIQEQNSELVELVERCRDVIQAYNDYRPTATGKDILQAIQDRLTKYNHLKSNTNE